MQSIDLNCDLGEGAGNDEQIMPWISSANIACGYHAGDEKTMWDTISLAARHHVSVGAHVSFLDRENFGRREMTLPAEEVYETVTQQLLLFGDIASSLDVPFRHVKPHGALYNMSARNPRLANVIARAVKDFDHELILYGLSCSCSIDEAQKNGLRTAREVFADRSYGDDGSLTPRSQPHALIEDDQAAIEQVLHIVTTGTVRSRSGKMVPVSADTVCIHGDGPHAAAFAELINRALKKQHIGISALFS